MMTKDQYIESLRKLNLNLYMFGKKVENPVDDPVIRPSLNSFAATYELAEDPQYQRSEERRGGNEGRIGWRSRWSP